MVASATFYFYTSSENTVLFFLYFPQIVSQNPLLNKILSTTQRLGESGVTLWIFDEEIIGHKTNLPPPVLQKERACSALQTLLFN